MNPLEETTIKLVAEGEVENGRIVLNPNGKKTIIRLNGASNIKRKIDPYLRENIINYLETNWLKYVIEQESININKIYRGKDTVIRNATERELIWFSKNEEAIKKPDFLDSRDSQRILRTNYVKNNETTRNSIEEYLHRF